jgi:hypothetical protein
MKSPRPNKRFARCLLAGLVGEPNVAPHNIPKNGFCRVARRARPSVKADFNLSCTVQPGNDVAGFALPNSNPTSRLSDGQPCAVAKSAEPIQSGCEQTPLAGSGIEQFGVSSGGAPRSEFR